MKNQIKRAKKFLNKLFKNHYMWAIIIPLFIPLLVSVVYVNILFEPRIIEPGDLLSFFGTAYGISASFILYRLERSKEQKKKRAATKPNFLITVRKSAHSQDLFDIRIENLKQECSYVFVYLYDEFALPKLNKEKVLSVCYSQPEEVQSRLNADLNIIDEIKMIDGYPEYIQIICEDSNGNEWNCCYFRVKTTEGFYYYPREIELI